MKKVIILLMAGLMIMPACRSSRSPELLHEHNNYSSSLYLPEEPLPFQPSSRSPELLHEHNNYSSSPYVSKEPFPFQLVLFFGFCSFLYCFVDITEFYLDEQEKFREQMKIYVEEKKRYDLKFLRSRYTNGIPKYRFHSYVPFLLCRAFSNPEKIVHYLLKYSIVAMMSICSYTMANSIEF